MAINIGYELLYIGFQKLVANNDITNKPIIEVKNKEVSLESCFETFLVITWYNPRTNAANRGIKALESKIDEVGLRIIKTPRNPIKIAIHVLTETFSFKIIADKATTITGAKEPTLWAFAKDRYLNDKTKHPDSIIDNRLLNICNLISLDL